MTKVTTYQPDELGTAIDTNRNLLLVHFGSPLASACELVRQELVMLAPVFNENALKFAEVELPSLDNMELIERFRLEEVPTLVLFSGAKEAERLTQVLLPEELKGFIECCVSYYYGFVSGREDRDA